MGGSGSGGANRKTAEEHRLNNTFRPIHGEGPPVVPLESAPRMPRGFTDEQRAAWKQVVKCIGYLGCLGTSDIMMLEAAAVAMANLRLLYRQENPDQKQLLAAIESASKCLTKLGLTPQSRATVRKIGGQAATDELDEFLKPPEGEQGR